MSTEQFFDEIKDQSAVKAAMVSEYFEVWANVVMHTAKERGGKIAYIDLFAGPGRYNDGRKSTPLLVLEKAIRNPEMCKMLLTIFNDKDPQNCETLRTTIKELHGIDKLKFQPQVMNREVGESIVRKLEEMKLVPTLLFVDPWGYKGLSLRLINSVLKDWGCDCIFFFNYNRINAGLGNELLKDHMDALFGEERADALRAKLQHLDVDSRELMIVGEIAEALKGLGGNYVLPFCFKNDSGTRTSHHLVFVTKHFRGYEIMKEIMAKRSTVTVEGNACFEYCPIDEQQPLLFDFFRPGADLDEQLLKAFAGRTLTTRGIYEKHSVDRPFIRSDYTVALTRLLNSGKIKTDRKPRAGTFADSIVVTFADLS